MELNEYQNQAMATCMESCDNFSYMMLNLVGEVGEFASKVAKDIRKDLACVRHNNVNYWGNAIDRGRELKKEAGDILWQLAGLCHIMGWTLEDVAQVNLNKLASRQQRGVIDGEGDNR